MSDYAAATIAWGSETLTLLELLKKQLDICENDTSRDTELSMWLQMAGLACEAYCQNVLCLQEVTERHPGTFSPISLRYYPATTLTSVTVDGEDATADYELFYSQGVDYATVHRSSAERADQFKQMDIVYQAGMEPLPAELGYAIVLAGTAYETQTVGVGQVKKESVVGVGTVEYTTEADQVGEGALSSSVLSALDKYRRFHV